MHRRAFLASAAAASVASACAPARRDAPAPPPDPEEQARTIEALRPPKRARPAVAILVSPHGSETVDAIAPFAVIAHSGFAYVRIVSPAMADIPLMPALKIRPHLDTAAFDETWPDGADYVIVPAMHLEGDPEILDWIRAQHEKGALVAGICAGALTLAAAGLLDGRRATTHWRHVEDVQRLAPGANLVRDRRYVVDGGVATTTGVSAALPFSLALVEAMASPRIARRVANDLGAGSWDAAHDSAAYALSADMLRTAVFNGAQFWRRQRIGIAVADHVDELALAFAADAYANSGRASAFAVADGGANVMSRRGLEIVPARNNGMADVLELPEDPPARALDWALAGIAERYGPATARLAALNLEYPWQG